MLLKDKDSASVSRGEKMISDNLAVKLKKKQMTNFEFAETTSRVVPLHDGIGAWKRHFSQADVVIEVSVCVVCVSVCVTV